jgi:hypothetical protein
LQYSIDGKHYSLIFRKKNIQIDQSIEFSPNRILSFFKIQLVFSLSLENNSSSIVLYAIPPTGPVSFIASDKDEKGT